MVRECATRVRGTHCGAMRGAESGDQAARASRGTAASRLRV